MVVVIVVTLAVVALDKTCERALSDPLGLQPGHEVVSEPSPRDHAQRHVQHDLVGVVLLAPGNHAFDGLVQRGKGDGDVVVATALELTPDSSLRMRGLHICRDGKW